MQYWFSIYFSKNTDKVLRNYISLWITFFSYIVNYFAANSRAYFWTKKRDQYISFSSQYQHPIESNLLQKWPKKEYFHCQTTFRVLHILLTSFPKLALVICFCEEGWGWGCVWGIGTARLWKVHNQPATVSTKKGFPTFYYLEPPQTYDVVITLWFLHN